jgi:50S ribosomal protein L16 3-hydroxylase
MSRIDVESSEMYKSVFAPYSAEQFVADFWPDRVLAVDGDPGRAPALFSAPELRDPFRFFQTHPGHVQLVFRTDPSDPATVTDVQVPAGRAAALYPLGMTASFPTMQRSVRSLASFASHLETITGVRPGTVDAIGALSRSGVGFNLHFDDIDVVVVQLIGRKRWTIGQEPAVRYPTASHVAGAPLVGELHTYCPSDIAGNPGGVPEGAREVIMAPGSVAFVPRGHWHRTEAVDGDSFSISFGFRTMLAVDHLLSCLRGRLLAQTRWRRPMLGGFGGYTHATTRRARAQLEELLGALAGDASGLQIADVLPAPSALEDGVAGVRRELERTFLPNVAKSRNVVTQFEIHEKADNNSFFVVIDDGNLTIRSGVHDSPTFTVSACEADFVEFIDRPGSGPELLRDGRLQIRPFDLNRLNDFLASFGIFGAGSGVRVAT